MPLTFPRDMTAGRCWEVSSFRVRYRQELSRRASGQPQGKDLGDPIWHVTLATYPLPVAEAEGIKADFDTLGGVLRSFYAFPYDSRRPASDIYGSTGLGGVTVGAIAGDRSELTLSGLPNGFVMTAGDYVSVTHGAGIDLYQLARGGTVSGGSTPSLAVNPPVRPGVSAGNAASVVDPVGEFVLEPGTLDMPKLNRRRRRVTLQALQVLR